MGLSVVREPGFDLAGSPDLSVVPRMRDVSVPF
jgi:hypothetical protein